MIEIPLTNYPEQVFKIDIFDSTYDLRIIYNSRLDLWSLSISKDTVDLVNGIALVGGVDIVQQFNLDFENMLMVNLEQSNQDPTKENFGTGSKLFVLTTEDLESVQTV